MVAGGIIIYLRNQPMFIESWSNYWAHAVLWLYIIDFCGIIRLKMHLVTKIVEIQTVVYMKKRTKSIDMNAKEKHGGWSVITEYNRWSLAKKIHRGFSPKCMLFNFKAMKIVASIFPTPVHNKTNAFYGDFLFTFFCFVLLLK